MSSFFASLDLLTTNYVIALSKLLWLHVVKFMGIWILFGSKTVIRE